jgi:hypothetical protein
MHFTNDTQPDLKLPLSYKQNDRTSSERELRVVNIVTLSQLLIMVYANHHLRVEAVSPPEEPTE